jgi:hypothetical protein
VKNITFALIALVATFMLAACASPKTQSSAPTATPSVVQAPATAMTPCATPTPDASPTATPTPEPTPDKARKARIEAAKKAIEEKYQKEQEAANEKDREITRQALREFRAQNPSACLDYLIAEEVTDYNEQYKLANANPVTKRYRDGVLARAVVSSDDRNARDIRKGEEIKALEQQ